MKDGSPRRRSVLPTPNTRRLSGQPLRREEADVQYLGIDWGTRRAAWCALSEGGELSEGVIAADEGGLARLVSPLGPDVCGCVEMMSGAVWVRDRLAECGWAIEIADARKVKAIPGGPDRPRRPPGARRAVSRRAWPPASCPAPWSRPSGCRRSRTARSASGCGAARTWSGCGPPR